MVTVPASSSASPLPSAQVRMYQARLQQARQEATQAQERVRELEAETDRARGTAMRSEDKLRGIERAAPEGQESRQPSIVNTQGQITGRVLNTVA